MDKWWTTIRLLIVLVALPGCALINTAKNSADPNLYDQFAAKQIETQQAQSAALALWDRIIFGESVSCQEAIPAPVMLPLSERDLQTHPAASLIQTHLNAAIQAVRNSADLWNIECAEDRPYVPLSMAREGRATALAANEPLVEVERLLTEW